MSDRDQEPVARMAHVVEEVLDGIDREEEGRAITRDYARHWVAWARRQLQPDHDAAEVRQTET